MTIVEELELAAEKRGEQRGELRGKIATALKMKEEGFDLNTIMRVTGLSKERLREGGITSES